MGILIGGKDEGDLPEPTSLHRLIYRSFLGSSLIPLFAIELVLLLVYFGVNSYLSEQQERTLLAEVRQNLVEISSREARLIDSQLREVANLAYMMQRNHERFFQNDNCRLPNGEPVFTVAPNGAYYKSEDNGGASAYYSRTTAIGTVEYRKIHCSEALDPFLESVVKTSPLITQAYLNTWDNMNRIYPYVPDIYEQYGEALNMQDYNFYYLADAEHNPERKHMWTGVYLDPAGQGWMVSSIIPIYNGDFLEGVSGLDVTIEAFVSNILTVKMPWNASVFMVDDAGMIMAMPESVELLLGLQELKSHIYDGSVLKTIEKPEEFNLLKSPDPAIQRQMKKILEEGDALGELTLGGMDFIASSRVVSETGWRIITLVDRHLLLAPINDLQQSSTRIGYMAIAVMVVFYILFAVYLEYKSRRLAGRLSEPIARLSEVTSSMGGKMVAEKLASVGITEIDRLNANFNQMASQLESRTRALVESESREKIRRRETEILERLAITDRLTGLYNRRKLDEVMNSELHRAVRYQQTFGIAILDIDMFKSINDEYGHQVGDQVIVELADLLRSSIRRSDTVGRWGGEEFILICPQTDLSGTRQVSENLCQTIAKHEFPIKRSVTASFGVAAWMSGESLDELLSRADKGLYEAKRTGRNKVAVAQG